MTKKNLKRIIGLIIFVLIVLISNNVKARELITTQLFNHADNHIYCVEHGKRFSGKVNFTEGNLLTVTDPRFAYILNLPDINYGNSGDENDVKSNMIWYYMKNGYSEKARIISHLKGLQPYWTNNWSQPQSLNNYINNMNNYVTEYNNYNKPSSVEITSINQSYDNSNDKINISVNVKATNVDSYQVFYDGKLQTGTSFSINSSEGGASKIIKVVGTKSMNVYKAQYRVLYQRKATKRMQTLIEIKNSRQEIVTKSTEVSKLFTVIQSKIDVSLQKYITKHNDEVKTDRRNKPTKYNNIRISTNNDGTTGNKKNENIINIEAGDTVTYTIEVYNNSNSTAKTIQVKDVLPKAVSKYKIDNNDIYINGNSLDYYIYNLEPGNSKSFTVTAYFGEYTEGVLENKAMIVSTTPTNNTVYRTEDYDFVQMKPYAVSLEKYITSVKRNSTIDLSSIVNDYYDIINYLKQNNKTINDLTNKTINIDYAKYDLDGNGIINEEDIAIYEKCKNITKENIETYIATDLNQDGIVDDTDLNIYKIIKANLNNDTELNNYDRYMYILKIMFDNNVDRDESLDYLYQKRLLQRTGKSKEELINIIDNFVKSDVNEDNIVDSSDNYKIENNKLIINSNEYKLNITEQITNLKDTSNLENFINNYDINMDNVIDNYEIEFFTEIQNYIVSGNSKYKKAIEYNVDLEDLSNKLQILLEKYITVNDKNDENKQYDLNQDSIIDYEDYNLASADVKRLINNLLDEDNNISSYDFDENNRIDSNDLDIITNYKNFLKHCENNIFINPKTIQSYKELIISHVTISKSDLKYYDQAYDINLDDRINFTDLVVNSISAELKEAINRILTKKVNGNFEIDFNEDNKINYSDYEHCINYYQNINNYINDNLNSYSIFDMNSEYDINNDGKIDYEDYSIADNEQKTNINAILFETYFDVNSECDINNDGKIDYEDYSIAEEEQKSNINEILSKNYKNISEEDINSIKVYKEWKEYNDTYSVDNENSNFDYTLYDVNNDNILNENDKAIIIKEYNENIKNNLNGITIDEIDTFITYFGENYRDEKLNSITIDTILNKENDLNDIINEMHTKQQDIDKLLSLEYNTSGISLDAIINQKTVNLETIDINGDGKVNTSDLTSFNIYKEKINNYTEFNETYITNNDINGDGKLDENDSIFKQHLDEINNNNSLKNAITEAVNNSSSQQISADGQVVPSRLGKPEHQSDDNTSTNDPWKYNNIVNVKKDDEVTYTIKVTNDSANTSVYITEITDYLPDGVKYDNIEYTGGEYNKQTDNAVKFNNLSGILLAPGESASFSVTVTVIEDNMSVNILKNVATITTIKNKNNVEVQDSTPNNNTDADYIELNGTSKYLYTSAYIEGFVWNDKALSKTQDNYNAEYNEGDENKLPGIKVFLYRKYGNQYNKVAETLTESNTDSDLYGYYSFKDNDLFETLPQNERYIKGPMDSECIRWSGSYYSYIVVFEYDGVKYTSTPDGTSYTSVYSEADSNNKSNASEQKAGEVSLEKREDFNNKFSTINSSSNIIYTTKNENNYIPQSIHEYNDNMNMCSATNGFTIPNEERGLTYLEHVNLGLRGRDIFDLELTSDVDNIEVTVNNQQNVYQYQNKVTIRKSDLTGGYKEDAANIANEDRIVGNDNTKKVSGLTEQPHDIRTSDLKASNANTNEDGNIKYDDSQGISEILVTYKITVQNTSRTLGTATKVTNYYDKKYTFVRAYSEETNLSSSNGESGTNYNSVMITTPGTMLKQSDKMEIYVVYSLNDPYNTLKGLQAGEKLPTYNMAEITEYKTKCASGQTEYTRGLIDKDSKPGSVSTETVRLSEGTSNKSTLQYYFDAQNLDKLKYEDDTYATPTLYFVANSNLRKITGTVFEDYTSLINNNGNDQSIRVKTGDGKKAEDEPGIKGVKVELYEIVENDEEPKLRYTTYSGEDGNYTFEGFLPGNYFIKYHYGDRDETFLVDNNPNTKSYNGEDFQATNNTGSYGSEEISSMPNFWYVYNKDKGISTAIDDETTRQNVSSKVIGFSDEKMTVLNNARDGKSKEDCKVGNITVDNIIEDTKMEAYTNSMLLTVEETIKNNDNINQNNSFTEYNVSNINFGIAEVPVTTIDLQKHVHSFTIKDSVGKNTIASAEIDLTNTAVTVNPSKIAKNRISTVITVLKDTLGLNYDDVENAINYRYEGENIDQNISIMEGLTQEQITALKQAIAEKSLAKEIKIVNAWKVTAGNVLAAPGANVIDVSIEDDKLQGAKLEITYEISASIYAEKNFNTDTVTVPSIRGIVDYIDNNLIYNENSITKNNNSNKAFWNLAKENEIEFGEGTYGARNGTLDPDGKKYNTILTVKNVNPILRESCGEGKTYVTLEKVLSSTDMTIQDIITSNVDIYTYQNSVEINKLDYRNQSGENGFIYRDRIRTADRYIILAGRQHDSATSEVISIHPPTGDNNINMIYLVIGIISLGILAAGAFSIKKFVLKK